MASQNLEAGVVRDLVFQQFVGVWLSVQQQSGERASATAKWLGN
jgi:hypothetical protein